MKTLILGSKGMLGGALANVFPDAVLWDRDDLDVTQFQGAHSKILELHPEAIINCVAFNDVDGAEEKKETAFLLNGEVPGELSRIAKDLGIPFVHLSTNYVFDGEQGEYIETDTPHPLSIYGQSKYHGEQKVQEVGGQYYIIRTSVLFGPKGESGMSKKSFVDIMLDLSQKTDTIKAVNDEINAITYVKDLAETIKVILELSRPTGIYHITNSGSVSWYELARETFRLKNISVNLIPVPATEFPRTAIRPKKAVLINTNFFPIRPWEEALEEYLGSRD